MYNQQEKFPDYLTTSLNAHSCSRYGDQYADAARVYCDNLEPRTGDASRPDKEFYSATMRAMEATCADVGRDAEADIYVNYCTGELVSELGHEDRAIFAGPQWLLVVSCVLFTAAGQFGTGVFSAMIFIFSLFFYGSVGAGQDGVARDKDTQKPEPHEHYDMLDRLGELDGLCRYRGGEFAEICDKLSRIKDEDIPVQPVEQATVENSIGLLIDVLKNYDESQGELVDSAVFDFSSKLDYIISRKEQADITELKVAAKTLSQINRMI